MFSGGYDTRLRTPLGVVPGPPETVVGCIFPGKRELFLEKSIPYGSLGWSRYFASVALKPPVSPYIVGVTLKFWRSSRGNLYRCDKVLQVGVLYKTVQNDLNRWELALS